MTFIRTEEQNTPVGDDPFSDPYSEQLSYASWYKMLQTTQKSLLDAINNIKNYSERQREKASPTIIDLSPSSGTPIPNTFQTTVRYRIIGMAFSGGQGDEFRLAFGGRHFHFFNITGGPGYIPFPVEVDRGVDITMMDITNPASTSWSCYLYGYPE